MLNADFGRIGSSPRNRLRASICRDKQQAL